MLSTIIFPVKLVKLVKLIQYEEHEKHDFLRDTFSDKIQQIRMP